MKTMFTGLALAAALAAATANAESSQLAANAGLSPAEAGGLVLAEIAAAKFNRDVRASDGQSIGSRSEGAAAPAALVRAAGVEADEASALTLTEIAARFFNENASADEQQPIVHFASRDRRVEAETLAAAAGLSAEDAHGLSLSEIAAHFFNESGGRDDRQRTARF